MITKTITYTDYNGVERTEDFMFNLSKAEFAEMELSVNGGFSAYLEKIAKAQDIASISKVFKELLLKAYGEKSSDGRRFIKSKELSEAFSQTEAYSELFMELSTNADAASKFVNGLGLIKSYCWSGKPDGGTGSPNYGKAGFPDVNAGYMYQQSKKKGTISTIPEIPGLVVYSKTHPHVGIYIGNGHTIESTLGSRGDGVVKRKLDSFWEYWFECPYIVYNDSGAADVSSLKAGDKVKISTAAVGYAGAGDTIKIPASLKGGRVFTISKVSGEMSLLKEIYSWVNNKDLIKI